MKVYGKLACALAMLLAPAASAADAERGRALYEMRCLACHSQSVHGRQKRLAADFEDVRAWVGRWNESLGLRWSREEIDDVAFYVNRSYYGFSCPPDVCTAISRLSRPR